MLDLFMNLDCESENLIRQMNNDIEVIKSIQIQSIKILSRIIEVIVKLNILTFTFRIHSVCCTGVSVFLDIQVNIVT